MDVQTDMNWQTIGIWVQAAILFFTAITVVVYTCLTWRLWKEAQRQAEVQLRPFVIAKFGETTQETTLKIHNMGNNTAVNIKITTSDGSMVGTPFLGSGESFSFVCKICKDRSSPLAQQFIDSGYLIIDQSRVGDPLFFSIEFENVDRQKYLLEEKLTPGKIEIISSGKEKC